MSSSPSYDSSSMSGMGGLQSGAPPIQELPRKWSPRLALIFLIAPLAVGFFVASCFGFLGMVKDGVRAETVVYPSFGILLAVGLAVLVAWRFWVESTRRAALYDTGLELVASGKTSTIRFESIDEVWITMQRVQAGGLIGIAISAAVDKMRKDKSVDERGVTISLRVVGGGTTIKLSNMDKGVFAAYTEIISRVNPRLIAAAKKRIDSGDPIAFGKISVSRDSLTFGKKSVQLSTIEKISIQNGQFSAKVTGKWFKSGQPVARIPNLYVLTALVVQLSNGTIEMDVPMGINLATRIYA
jgi:hypothetical protein